MPSGEAGAAPACRGVGQRFCVLRGESLGIVQVTPPQDGADRVEVEQGHEGRQLPPIHPQIEPFRCRQQAVPERTWAAAVATSR